MGFCLGLAFALDGHMKAWKTALNDAETAVESGKRIEEKACYFLAQQEGLKILYRNYRVSGGEIDIIAEERSVNGIELVIVEVRARQTDGWVDGLESIRSGKIRRIERATKMFLMEYRGTARQLRFDVISVDEFQMKWIRNAW